MNKPFFIGNPIIGNYLKTPAGQEELKTAIEKIKSVELPRGLILTEKQYMQIASTFLCIEEKIAYDEKPALYKLETVNLMIWFALLDPNREATLNQERNKVKISYMLYNLYQHTFKVFKEVCHFEIAILGKKNGISITCDTHSNYQKAKLLVQWKKFVSTGELSASIVKPLEAIRNFIEEKDLKPARHKIRPNKIIANQINKIISNHSMISQRQYFIYIYNLMLAMEVEERLPLRNDSDEKRHSVIRDYLLSDINRENEERKEYDKLIKNIIKTAIKKQ